jgi:hypothetical protein
MSLKSILQSIGNFVSGLWSKLEPELKIAIHIGVLVTDSLKSFIDSPAADILTAIIPGDVDDHIKNWLRAELPNILVLLKLSDDGGKTPDEIVRTAIKTLKELDPSIKGNFLDGLAIAVAQVAADGKLTWDDGKYLLKWYYDNQYKLQQ